ncbi:Six-hairpin glycosidase-like protein [Aspergillus alliaceus]|uniref:Six-hairpin glycosidase-like protein n=1 Tax=Petromyces alliaceus TaxID=209559 RepID=A0A5N7C4M6_PETAA|nr:Six-hairpin glycosidase-like protein [Aspergillus alliaceus]
MSLVHSQGLEMEWSEARHRLFNGLRLSAIIHSIGTRKPTYLGTPEWTSIPWRKGKKQPKQYLFDLMAEIPALLEAMDSVNVTSDISQSLARLHEVCERYMYLAQRLYAWYETYMTDHPSKGHWEQPSRLPSVSPNERSPPTCIGFPDHDTGHIHLLYWTSHVLLFSNIGMVYESCVTNAPHGAHISLPPFPCDIQEMHGMALNIARSAEYFLEPKAISLGACIISFPASIAFGYFEYYNLPECDWFRQIFRYIKTFGIDVEGFLDAVASETSGFSSRREGQMGRAWRPSQSTKWDVSIRTIPNCMIDGFSDCPVYEQLQYSGGSRAVGLFHYLLSRDDGLMRQVMINFATSATFEGLTQSRFQSHVPQLIAGFSLYWALQVCDHHLYFGGTQFARSFLPRIDGVLDFFDSHIDSMLYAYVLQQVARLVHNIGRPGYATEYETRALALQQAIRAHCYGGHFFTDSTADIADDLSYSQHCQAFAVISWTARPDDRARLLTESFADPHFSKCSCMMQFCALWALPLAGDEVYESFWPRLLDSWRKMLANNLTTWEEVDVRQRSDCHAWSSVPIYEYCTELAGIRPIAPGSTKVLFKPRLGLNQEVQATIAAGKDNIAIISWATEH